MENIPEGKTFGTFEKRKEFISAQNDFLALDLWPEKDDIDHQAEHQQLYKLLIILDEYQEQSYLLDPFLEELVTPVIEALKSFAKKFVLDPDQKTATFMRVFRLSSLIYGYIKFRGHKTITRFFPHEIADLSIVLSFVQLPESPVSKAGYWELRYVSLLWLSLICRIPFDLGQFDEKDGSGATKMAIEKVGLQYVGNAGLERDASSLLLARLYMRKDAQELYGAFLDRVKDTLNKDGELLTVMGHLQVLSEVIQSGPASQVTPYIAYFLELGTIVNASETLSANTLIRKHKAKVISRAVLRLLPGRSGFSRRQAKVLSGAEIPESRDVVDETAVPEDVELVLEQLFEALQDKDTIVRWSAAKGVARIAERLPSDFADQVLETVIGLFSVHSIAAAALYDVPSIAEGTWHGACLACAEIARRGLVSPERLEELISWLSRALYFDVRKGAHSVGSNVRDAAAYVLWALARTQSTEDLAPHMSSLARRLVTVALFDREIQIRRASSAAFQEYVGRTSLFPHGIDVLRKTDFYAISVRKNAFLVSAPQVAEHPEYRPYLFDHILDVTLRHWDVAMREPGAQSLRLICMYDLAITGPQALSKLERLLESPDIIDVHGALLGLQELSIAFHQYYANDPVNDEKHQRQIFQLLNKVPHSVLSGPRNELVSAGACTLIAHTITLAEINLGQESSVPTWRRLLDHGLKHRNASVQEAATASIASVSKLVDCSAIVDRELKPGSVAMQQSLGRVLGAIDYDRFPSCLGRSIDTLMECASRENGPFNNNVEARRNCYIAMPALFSNIIGNINERITPITSCALFDTLLNGLEDYSLDERGDVGSWVRMACIRGLATITELLVLRAREIGLEAFLPPKKFHEAIGGILRQGVERLDNVRNEAGLCFVRMLRLDAPSAPWEIEQSSYFRGLVIPDEEETMPWSDGVWLFSKAVHFLEVPLYRKQVLKGLIVSLGSKTDSTQRPLANSLTAYVADMPVVPPSNSLSYSLVALCTDLVQSLEPNMTSNAIVVPTFQTFNVLLEAGSLRNIGQDITGITCLRRLLGLCCRNFSKLKSSQRITESLKIVINLAAFPPLYEECVAKIPEFLNHRFPTVRLASAEYLYMALQTMEVPVDTEEVENILLETEWSAEMPDMGATAQSVADGLLAK